MISAVAGTCSLSLAAIQLKRIRILGSIGRDSMWYYGLHFETLAFFKQFIPSGGYRVLAVGGTILVVYMFLVLWKKYIQGKEKTLEGAA